jgi:hypothetical protein
MLKNFNFFLSTTFFFSFEFDFEGRTSQVEEIAPIEKNSKKGWMFGLGYFDNRVELCLTAVFGLCFTISKLI